MNIRRPNRPIIAVWLGALLVSTAALAAQPASADNAQPRLRYRIVVDQGKWEEIHTDRWSLPPDVSNGIQAQLIDKLQKSGYFIVLEREGGAVRQGADENAIDANRRASLGPDSGVVAPRQVRTAADYIITPSVFGFKQTNSGGGGIGFGNLVIGAKKSQATLTLNIRISNAQTSEILDTQTASGKAESGGIGVAGDINGTRFGMADFNKSPAGKAVNDALDDAVSKIIGRLSKEPWRASVAAQDPETRRVIINAGDLAGVSEGMTFDVFRAGHPVIDPDTGQIISAGDRTRVGRIRVVRVEHNASYCDVVEGGKFLPRDIVQARW
ncbi:MAG: CsgG/HfaB family protein [Capsulimonadaceae bacterium]|nr:CsgG/HfaB family protein [Capsulimonadaceae bacterium]